MMRVLMLSLITVLVLTGTKYAQNKPIPQSEKRHFEITSFLVNGRHVRQFRVAFLINGREIVPERDRDTIFVPDEVYSTGRQANGIRFTVGSFHFVFESMPFRGYLDSDKIKSDYNVYVDTIPNIIKVKHVSQLNEKERLSLGIRSYRDVCSVYSLAASNIAVYEPGMILDPITVKRFNLCKNKGLF